MSILNSFQAVWEFVECACSEAVCLYACSEAVCLYACIVIGCLITCTVL